MCYNTIMKRIYRLSPILLSILLSVSLLTGCSLPASQTPVSQVGFYFDTVITITLYGNQNKMDKYIDGCFEMAEHYESILSRTVEGSDIDKINKSHGQPVTVDEDTAYLLSQALYYAELSNGAIDPTIGSVSSLWDFHSENPSVPSSDLIAEGLKHVDYTKVHVEGNTVTLDDPDAIIDLGFIAKGFIADKMKEYLLSNNITSGIINLGGNVLTIGTKPDGSNYTIGIQDPFHTSDAPYTTFSVSDTSVVSSGSYERCFTIDDVTYFHILDTNTGYPVDTDLVSVSILSKSSLEGDAYSTMLFILGSKKAKEIDEANDDISVFLIEKPLS